MLKNFTLTNQNILIALLFIIAGFNNGSAQLYQHNFGTTAINSHPYTVAPSVLDASLSNSSWTNNTGAWVSYVGSSGQALGLANSSGSASVTLTFTVAPGKQITVDSFSFWRQRSNNGAPNWAMTINGINVGSGTIPTSGASTGVLAAANPVSNLTGNINVTISLSGAAGAGTFRVDDFTLTGSVTNSCIAPVINSLSPLSGPVNTIVTLNGSGFQAGSGTSAVKFNGIDSQSFTVVSDTQITAIVPAAATSGAITVTTNGCPGTAASFTVTSAACNLAPPSDIYISELYDQQSGSGGMIEIYNPTATTITLSNYTLERYGDITDNTAAYTLILSGTLAPESILLVACTTPNPAICATPTASQILGAGFNGGDKFQLLKNGVLIDRIDIPLTGPGYTLIRKPDAVAPKTVYSITDWNNTQHPADNSNPLPNNFCNDLGNHNAIPATGTTPTITHPIAQTACENASVTFSVTISDPTGFTYQWKVLNTNGTWTNITNGGNYAGATTAALTINNLPALFNKNQYYCEMTSGSTCTLISNAAQLTVNPSPAEAVTTVTQPTCTTATGTITVNSPTGVGFTYSIDETTYQATTTFTNLASGSYTVTVKNVSNCTSSVTVMVNTAPAAPAIAVTTITQPTCTTATGTITVNSPLAADLTYSIDGTTFQAGTSFLNLQPGDYTITTKNAAGCTSVTNTIIINTVPAAPAIATFSAVQPTCTTPTGSITVSAPIGAGLTYSIDGTTFQIGTSFTNLIPGNYIITVKNAAGCTSVTNTITVNPVPGAPAVADVTATQPSCAVISTGSIIVNTPTGAGITYSIDGTNFQTETLFTNLPSGSYNVTVKNAAGCTSVTNTITINAATPLPAIADVTVSQPTCVINTGSIEVTSPLTAGLEYSIDGVTFQTAAMFNNLQPGQYIVTVKNAEGCTSVTNTITINVVPAAPAIADITIVQPTCAIATATITVTSPVGTDLTYSIDGTTFQTDTTFANLQQGTYTITIKNNAGCTSVTNSIAVDAVPGAPAIADVTITQPTCAIPTGTITISSPTGTGFSYSIDGTNFQPTAIFGNLQPGSYSITVKNIEGCISVTNPTMINPVTGAPASANVSTVQPTCAVTTGSITINSPTATDLTYSIDGVNFQAGTTFTNLQPGSYTVIVKNTEGCTSLTNGIIINPIPAAPSITTTQGCRNTTFGQNYILEATPLNNSFDVATASFKWTNGQGAVIGNDENTFDVTRYVSENTIDASDFPIEITVSVTNFEGCESSETFTVDSYFCNIPRGISPNNDGMNDSFNLTGMNVKTVKIFNRYGAEVYTANNYMNEWHGQSDNGNELPTGTYYYTLEVSGQNTQTGWVYINREEK